MVATIPSAATADTPLLAFESETFPRYFARKRGFHLRRGRPMLVSGDSSPMEENVMTAEGFSTAVILMLVCCTTFAQPDRSEDGYARIAPAIGARQVCRETTRSATRACRGRRVGMHGDVARIGRVVASRRPGCSAPAHRFIAIRPVRPLFCRSGEQ